MTTSPSTPTPPTPKTPFLLADGLVLLVVLLLVWTGSTPLGLIEKIGIALCLGLGGVITATPFVIDRKRRKEPAAPAPVVSESAPVEPEPVPSAPQTVSVEPIAPAEPIAQVAVPSEPPAWVAEFQALQARLDALEQTLSHSATTAHAGLRQLLDEHRANETQSLAAAQETLQRTLAAFSTIEADAKARLAELRTIGEQLAASQQTAASQADALLATLRAATAEHRETARHAIDEATSAARNAFAAEADRLLARLDEQSTAALAAWESRSTAIIQERVAAEIAEERAAAARRSVAAATLVLESSPAAAPSGKSRLGRGLESLITSPQAKPVATAAIAPSPVIAETVETTAQPTDAQLSLPVVETSDATIPSSENTPVVPIDAVTPKPTQPREQVLPKREPAIIAIDPFFIPANGYADLGSAMDAENASASKRR